MNTKLLIMSGLAVTFIASTFAGSGEGRKSTDRRSPEEMVARIIVKNDTNDDSALNVEELEGAIVKMQERRKERMAKMREQFGDREGKGLRGEGRKRPEPAEVAEIWITEFDFDESGSLDGAELLEAMGSMRPRGPHGENGPPPPPNE